MMENKENKEKERKENIQQRPDRVDDKNRMPVTPEPPQRKDPLAKPEAERKKEK